MKRVLNFLACILLISCQPHAAIDQLPVEEVPYQCFIVDENTEVRLYLYDRYGTKNKICVTTNDTVYSASIEVDPIPAVKTVRNDTIFLEYHNFKSQGKGVVCRQSNYEWAQRVGPYTIINCRHYDIAGSRLIPCGNVDSLSIDGSELSLVQGGKSVRHLCINDAVFERSPDGTYHICYQEIDSISQIQITYCYTIEERQIPSRLFLHPVHIISPS